MIVFTPFQPRMTPLLGSAEVQKALDKCTLFRYTRGKGVRCPEMCKQEATSRRKARKERPAMPISPEPKQEHPSTYFVQDRSNQEELNRLQIQDHLYTAGMGGRVATAAKPARH